MKSKLSVKRAVVALLCGAILAGSAPQSVASTDDGGRVAVDALLVRPFCLLSTIVGSAIFVISLPIAVPTRSVHSAAHALVVKPAQATFARPLGDLEDLDEYE
jgi:hypothetical protein